MTEISKPSCLLNYFFVEIFCYHNRKETQKEPHKHSLPDLFLGPQFWWVPEVVAHQS